MFRRNLRFFGPLLLIAVSTFMTSCGSDNPADPVQQEDTPVSGAVVKGPVAGALVEIWTMDSSGGTGTLAVGDITTDASGAWSAVIPGSVLATRFLVAATGGSYIDEATETTEQIPAGTRMLGYLDRSRPTSVVVTPYTHMLYLQTQTIVVSAGAALAWERAIGNASAANSFGFDPTTTIPSWDENATVSAKAYAALLGGLSELVQGEPTYEPISAAGAFVKAMAVATDIMDGSLDGRAAGVPIVVPLGGAATGLLPSLSGTGVAAISEWAMAYAQNTPGLGDAALVSGMVVVLPSGGPEIPDCARIAELRTAARASLENALFATFNGPDVEEPSDVDFSEPQLLYEAVLDCQPADLNAHLALTILQLTALSRDPEINDAFDRWDAYLDQMVPFETDAPTSKLSVPMGFDNPTGAMELPFGAIRKSLVPYLNLRQMVAPPQIAEVQDIFRNRVLPRVLTGIAHMNAVVDDPGFTFSLSPRMQGDLFEEERVADHTDFLAIRAGLNALAAGLRIAISYNVNLEDYTGAHLLSGLQQTSGHLATLQGDGATQMQAVPALLGAAANDMNDAINALLAETDDQTDDLIKIGPDDIDESELLEFQDEELDMIRQSLAGPMTSTFDWDFDPGTPDQEMTVDLNHFFMNPLANFKALLPPYTVALEVVPYDENSFWEQITSDITVTVPATDYYYFYANVTYSDFELERSELQLPTWAEAAVTDLIDSEIAIMRAAVNWSGYCQVTVSFYDQLAAGSRNISVNVSRDFTRADSWVEVAVVTFAADTYAQWLSQCPDPTIGGLFPEVTSALELAEAFGMEEHDWEKQFSLDWSDDGLGFTQPPSPPPPPTPSSMPKLK
jgi:hypothetical protein